MKEIVQDRYILLHTVNRKYYMAYRFVLVRWLWMILDDLVAGLIKCNSTNTCTAFRTVSTDTARRAVPRRQLTELLVYISDAANCDKNTDLWFRCCAFLVESGVNPSIRCVWKSQYNKPVHTLTIRSQPYAHCAYLIANHLTINMQMTYNYMYHSTWNFVWHRKLQCSRIRIFRFFSDFKKHDFLRFFLKWRKKKS